LIVAFTVLTLVLVTVVALRPTGLPVVPVSTPEGPLISPRPLLSPRGVVVAAVGDMVCDPADVDVFGQGRDARQCQYRRVSDLVVNQRPAALLALGDTQYEDGALQTYRTTYAPTFVRLLDITHPAPGNHEYHTLGASGYFGYFGARAGSSGQGYYSFDLGGWHVVALNSNCGEVSCGGGQAQERWLRADLAAHPAPCTIAYWHHPRWSHGQHGDNQQVAPLVQALYDGGVDVLLTGHDHDYERFTPRAPDGSADPRGLREFVVGTGGRDVRSARAGIGTEAVNSDSFGALFLTLTPTGYGWQFMASNGSGFSDSGSATCP
jgi:hypothetical protein